MKRGVASTSCRLGLRLAVAWVWVASASQVASAVLPSPNEADTAAAGGVALLPMQLADEIVSLGPGIAFWMRQELDIAGVDLLSAARLARLSGTPVPGQPPAETWKAIARRAGASHLLVSHLRLHLGRVRFRLSLVEGMSAEVVAGAEASGPFAKLSGVLREATASLLERVDLSSVVLRSRPLPRLSELASATRSLEHLRAGRLKAAYDELDRRHSPLADALRARIGRRVADRNVPFPERARVAIARGEVDRTWLRLRRQLRGNDDPALLLAAAEASEARGEPERAAAFFDRVAELDPDQVDAHLGAGRMHAGLGEVELAHAAYRRAARLRPEDPRPLEALARSRGTSPEVRAQLLLEAGRMEARLLNTEYARSDLERASQLDPALSADAHAQLGSLHGLLGSAESAIDAYETAVRLGPQPATTWTDLGALHRSQGNTAGAKIALGHALEQDPAHAPAHLELGELLDVAGHPDQALPHLEKAVAFGPGDGRSRRSLARALRDSGDSERALPLLHLGEGDQPANSEDLRLAAEILEGSGDLEAARLSLEEAVRLQPTDGSLHADLARVHEARGDSEAAAAARSRVAMLSSDLLDPDSRTARPSRTGDTFAALVATFPVARFVGERVALLPIHFDRTAQEQLLWLLKPRTLDTHLIELELARAIEAYFELDRAPPVVAQIETELRRLEQLDTSRSRIALANDVLTTGALFVARLDDSVDDADGEALGVSLRMLAGRDPGAVSIYANESILRTDLDRFVAWNPIALGIYGVLGFCVLLPLLRGWGTVKITLDYGAKGKGFFSVKLSRRAEKAKQGKAKPGAQLSQFQRRMRSLARFQRFMAGKQTIMRWIPARTYRVGVHGLLQDPITEQVIGNHFEERTVRVRRGRTVELYFDFRPREAPVSIQIFVGDELAERAQVAVLGSKEPVKYVRNGQFVLVLGPGSHNVAVGLGDCVLQRRIEVSTLEPMTIAFSNNDPRIRLFEGCADAVDPYLIGDVLAAAQILEGSGQANTANLLRGHHYRAIGETRRAAECLQAAGELMEAAELGAFEDDPERSASLYEEMGDYARAAETFQAAGNPQRAGAAYEASYEFDKAIEAYKAAGNHEKVVELLERTGNHFQAGVIGLEQKDIESAVNNLQRVDLRDPDYVKACEMLSDVLAQRGDFEVAAQKLSDAVDACGGEDLADPGLLKRFGDLLERSGRPAAAIEILRVVQRRDLSATEVSPQIRRLEETLSQGVPGSDVSPAASRESRYEILDELGRGGMGVVMRARDRRLGRVVALKRLPENLRNHPTAVQLFLREARAAAALNHPNIVTLFDAGQEDGHYFITMEHLNGFPLDVVLSRLGKLTPKDTARIGVQVAKGLSYAHEHHVVHRDIKTANLFFTRDRVVKIMDFGLAKMMEEVRRATTVIGGTPYYMAPEQAAGDPVDHRADLYAFGVTLFELVTGGVPFPSGDVTYHHRHTPAPDPRDRVEEVPDAMADLILALLVKDPDARTSSASEVGRGLQKALEAMS